MYWLRSRILEFLAAVLHHISYLNYGWLDFILRKKKKRREKQKETLLSINSNISYQNDLEQTYHEVVNHNNIHLTIIMLLRTWSEVLMAGWFICPHHTGSLGKWVVGFGAERAAVYLLECSGVCVRLTLWGNSPVSVFQVHKY